jgi:1,4-alpha-glucan branching enzyme
MTKAMKPTMPEEESSTPVEHRNGLAPQRRASHHHRQFEVMGAHPLTAGPRTAQGVALPAAGTWHEVLNNSDAAFHGGSGVGKPGRVPATSHAVGGWPASALVTVPPLATVILSDRPIPTTDPTQGVPHARH